MAHNAVRCQEFERGHLKQGLVEEKLPGCGTLARLQLQALLNELLKKKREEGESGLMPTQGEEGRGSAPCPYPLQRVLQQLDGTVNCFLGHVGRFSIPLDLQHRHLQAQK